jgi:tetratricopeptide (TPR) repeat protein
MILLLLLFSGQPSSGTALVAPIVGTALAADRATPDKLKDLEAEVLALQDSITELSRNFTERSGLIGVSEARQRYEDAVYQFLIGDYEHASSAFYILVQSRALGNADLARDSEWYLGESLFLLGNYRTATEAYRVILDKGKEHPFFVDAVRRSLEAFALVSDVAAFDSYYNLYIKTGQVQANDLINYTLAKSFRIRNETSRAREAFEAIPADSEYYTRARYFLGVYAIQEGRLNDAIVEFQRIESTPVSTPQQQEVLEMALLAQGSLYYETGNFAKATEYYQKIPPQSSLYADQLYQSIWSFIKQEYYNEALAQIDVFLLHFPDHREVPALRLLQAKLQMKLERYEEAQANFEQVVEAYGPIEARLDVLIDGNLKGNPTLEPYLARAISETAPDPGGLPIYALDRLYSSDEVQRAVTSWQTIQAERTELADAERALRELDLALATSNNTLGAFVAARNQLDNSRAAIMALRTQLLEIEGQYLRSRVPGSSRNAFVTLLNTRQEIVESMAFSNGQGATNTDRMMVYDAQTREVQNRAMLLVQEITELEQQLKSLLEKIDGPGNTLSADETRTLRAQLVALQQALAEDKAKLDELGGEPVRRSIMSTVESAAPQEDTSSRMAVIAQIEALKKQIAGYRRYATDADSAAFFAQLDRLWALLDQLDQQSIETAQVLRTAETKELAMVHQRLQKQREVVAQLRTDLQNRGDATQALAMVILRSGMEAVRDEFSDTILAADKGIVDVYWVRKTRTVEEMEALMREQSRLLSELNDQYAIIERNLAGTPTGTPSGSQEP